jgi:hypothetical protein
MDELPLDRQVPVPIPEPKSALLASICESEIKMVPIDELDPECSDKPDPMPVPCPELVTTLEFQIPMLSMRENPVWYESAVPIPAPASVLVAQICESEIPSDPIQEFDPAFHVRPVPIPEPDPAFATTVVFPMLIPSIRELPPPVQYPVPIQEHHTVLLASTCESEIKRDPIDELDPADCARQLPIPGPSGELVRKVEFRIVMLSIRENPPPTEHPVPMQQPRPRLVALISESEITRDQIDDPNPVLPPRFVPIPVSPDAEMLALTNETVWQESSRPTPTPGDSGAPWASRLPVFTDVTVTFDCEQSSAWPMALATERKRFEPSTITITSL